MRVMIKRVDIGSTAKVLAVLNMLIWAVFGLFIMLFQSAIFTFMSSSISSRGNSGFGDAGGFAALGLGALCIGYIVGIVVAGIFGGIAGAIYAFLYNLVVGWVGGIEVDLERNAGDQNLPPMSEKQKVGV